MTLYSEVLSRLGTQAIVELTNEAGGPTTIDSAVLQNACDDAEGAFLRETGTAPDVTNKSHLEVLVRGARAYLEDYKGRDSNLSRERMKSFFAALKSLRSSSYQLARTSSVLEPSEEQAGSRPDFDRNSAVWKPGASVSRPGEIAN